MRDEKKYAADVVVGIKESGEALLYDVLNLKPSTITEKEMDALNTEYPSPRVDRNSTLISEHSIPQSAPSGQEKPAGNVFGPNVLPTAKETMEQARRKARAAKAKTETERTGILFGAREDAIRDATNASKATGIDVRFYRKSGRKILGFLDKIRAKFGNADARERVFIDNARKIYARALQETAGSDARQSEARNAETAEHNASAPPDSDNIAVTPSFAKTKLTDAEIESARHKKENQSELRAAREN